MPRRVSILPLLSLLTLPFIGCVDQSIPTGPMSSQRASLVKAPGAQDTKKLFSDYVAMGSSIAAGFMSGGISETTQLEAYPVLLADRAGAKCPRHPG